MAQSREVILDANFLLLPGEFKVDVVEEINRLVPGAKLVTLEAVVDEVRGSALAMKVLEKNNVEVIPGKGVADELITERATARKSIVATNDKDLVKALRTAGVPVVFLRSKTHCELKGVIA